MIKFSVWPLSPFSLQRFMKLLFCIFFTFTIFSCAKDKQIISSTGQITLSSKTIGTSPYYIMGYSFEKNVFFKSLNSSSEIDIYLNELLFPNGDLAGVQFTTSTKLGLY